MPIISGITNLILIMSAFAAPVSSKKETYTCPTGQALKLAHFLKDDELRSTFNNVLVERVYPGPPMISGMEEMFYSTGDHKIFTDQGIGGLHYRVENDTIITTGYGEGERTIKVFTYKRMMFFRMLGPTSTCWRVSLTQR